MVRTCSPLAESQIWNFPLSKLRPEIDLPSLLNEVEKMAASRSGWMKVRISLGETGSVFTMDLGAFMVSRCSEGLMEASFQASKDILATAVPTAAFSGTRTGPCKQIVQHRDFNSHSAWKVCDSKWRSTFGNMRGGTTPS